MKWRQTKSKYSRCSKHLCQAEVKGSKWGWIAQNNLHIAET